MSTTTVHPNNQPLREALTLATLFAAALFLFHLAANLWQSHTGWGYFRDEFYYIACGRHLAWGYVDHGPLVAIQARLAETLFGHSLAGLRALSALAGSARLFLTGLLAWSLGDKPLGGRRPAQALAMFGVALAPQYLALDGFLSMNSVESLFWMPCLLALTLMIRGGSPRLWLLFGLSAGLGLLNKPSMTFFLIALLIALLFTPTRRLLATPWAAAGVALLLLIVLPNLLWQAHNHWPTWEFLENGRIQHKNKELAPIPFLITQILNLEPASLLIWLPGLIFLLRRTQFRFLGLTYLFFLAGMMALHAKDYYVVPIYPILFAAGGLAWETRYADRLRVQQNRVLAFPTAIATLAIITLATLPMSTPILTPAAWVAYAKATHLFNAGSNSEKADSGQLPQFYADRFAWQEEVDQVEHIAQSLSPEDRAKAVILCGNYGEAGALQFLGHNLPPVISGHNNYFVWGPHKATGEVVIAVFQATLADMRDNYNQVTPVGSLDVPYAMPPEREAIIFLARDRKRNLTADWPDLKHYE